MKTSIAIYPGSFDPVTNGHLDLIERGEKMFDLLIVAVLRNAEKQPLFSVAERVDMLREVTKQWTGVEIDVFDGAAGADVQLLELEAGPRNRAARGIAQRPGAGSG